MKTINNYILEKLKINKEVKLKAYISGEELFSFLNKYIFKQMHKVNNVNLSKFKSFLTGVKNAKFNIYCLPEHKEIWNDITNFEFINYENYKIPESTDYLYLGSGIYIWFDDKEDNIVLLIIDSKFNDFNHGYKPIIINRK